jgi:hypothetical protein
MSADYVRLMQNSDVDDEDATRPTALYISVARSQIRSDKTAIQYVQYGAIVKVMGHQRAILEHYIQRYMHWIYGHIIYNKTCTMICDRHIVHYCSLEETIRFPYHP